MPIDARAFRQTVGQFVTGVTVIAADFDGAVRAMTANSFTSLSLDPPLVLFCVGKTAHLGQLIHSATGFSVNILQQDQQPLSTYFAGGWKEAIPPPFRFVSSRSALRLEGSLASIDCETQSVTEAGDHWIMIGRVLDLHIGIAPHKPLLFYKGRYEGVDFSESKPAPDLVNVHDEPAHIFYES